MNQHATSGKASDAETPGPSTSSALQQPSSRAPQPAPGGKRMGGEVAITLGDIATLAGLVPLTLFAWLLPERFWTAVCRAAAPLAVPMFAAAPARTLDRMLETSRELRSRDQASALLRQLTAEHVETLLQVLKCHRPGGWRPSVSLNGRGHVGEALAAGRGAVLWVSYSIYHGLVVKQAFHQAGLPFDHLSRPGHGFSDSRFGRSLLNPIHTSVENAHLRERVLLDEGDPGAVLRALEQRLRDNRLVSVTVHRRAARPAHPTFLNGRLTLAPGAPILGFRTGAPILPVFGFRDRDGQIRVTVERPLDLTGSDSVGEAITRAAADYARRLEPYVERCPAQWRGWLHL